MGSSKTKCFILTVLCCLAAAVLSAACSAPAPAAPPAAQPTTPALTKVRVTQSTADSVSFMTIYIARYFNFFGDEGLAADVITTGGGGPDVAALIAGEAQFTAAGPINQLALFQEGKRTLSVAGFQDNLVANLVMRKDVYEHKGLTASSTLEQKLAALKGTKISITRPGALTDMVARSYLRRAGLDPAKDAQIVATQSGQPQIAAIEQKQVDVASVTSPAGEVMVDRGVGTMLVSNTRGEDPFFKPFTQQAILVRQDYARDHPETVKAFVRAIVKANKWAGEHSAEEAAKIMNVYVPSLKVEDIARDFGAIKSAIPATGCMTEKGVLANVELFNAAGLLKQEIKFADLATNEFLPAKCGAA
jgi:NitT/TauT family transport system substrate-binding protein